MGDADVPHGTCGPVRKQLYARAMTAPHTMLRLSTMKASATSVDGEWQCGVRAQGPLGISRIPVAARSRLRQTQSEPTH